MGSIRALRILHRAFARYPARDRIHILIRYLTCPFGRFIDEIPAGARVLEIGSGHALYARLIAEERAAEVVAVDPDVRKSLLPSPLSKVKKVAGYDDCIRGTFGAVAMVDVAYRMPVVVRRNIFRNVFERLEPGGVFIVKEMDVDHPWKMKWARLQEWVSDAFLKQTLGEGFFSQPSEELQAMLEEIGFTGFQSRPIDRGYPHPHIVYTARRPERTEN
jgi:SAM-dependent methyltransferase